MGIIFAKPKISKLGINTEIILDEKEIILEDNEVLSLNREIDRLNNIIKILLGELRDDECPICQKLLYSENEINTICNHKFHLSCINNWIFSCSKNHKSTHCPVCRTRLCESGGNLIELSLSPIVSNNDEVSFLQPDLLSLDTELIPLNSSIPNLVLDTELEPPNLRLLGLSYGVEDIDLFSNPNPPFQFSSINNLTPSDIISSYYNNELGLPPSNLNMDIRTRRNALAVRISNLNTYE